MKTATAPIISQFRSEFEKLFDWNYRSCDHEREIADDIENDVRKLLEKFGLLDYEPELAALDKCRFCGSTEWALVHQAWCIESPTLSVLTNRSPVGGKP